MGPIFFLWGGGILQKFLWGAFCIIVVEKIASKWNSNKKLFQTYLENQVKQRNNKNDNKDIQKRQQYLKIRDKLHA